MKLKFIIEDYKNENLSNQNSECFFNGIYEVKEKFPDKHFYIQFAVLTDEDINKIPEEYINKEQLFNSDYILIFSGEIMILTECGVKKLPYILKNDEFFITDPKSENRNLTSIIDILQAIERHRCRCKNQSDLLDYSVRCCEAVVAKAIGYKSRVDWAEIIQKKLEEKKFEFYEHYFNKEKINILTEDDYYGLDNQFSDIVNLMNILYEMEMFRNKFQLENISGNESIKICEAIIARNKGYRGREEWISDIREKEVFYTTKGMKELFKFNWDKSNWCVNNYIIEWFEANGYDWHYNKFARLEFYTRKVHKVVLLKS